MASFAEFLLGTAVRVIGHFLVRFIEAKSLTFDRQVSLIGSANSDRRNFDLNYEYNILIQDATTTATATATLRERQMTYVAASRQVTLDEVRSWNLVEKLGNNTVAMFGPVL